VFEGPNESEPKSKKRFADKPKEKTLPVASKATVESVETKPVRNFAPLGEAFEKAGQNQIHWEGFIAGSYYVKLQNWKKRYLAIRQNQNIGANAPIEYFYSPLKAVKCLKKVCGVLNPTKMDPIELD